MLKRSPCVKADGTLKTRYGTPERAEKAAKLLRENRPVDADLVHVYHCPDCRYWHVGHSSVEPA